jgi:DNA-binding response OmpR family regulator
MFESPLASMDSRTQAVSLMRNEGPKGADVYTDSCFHIEHRRYFVAVKGTRVPLTKTEFRVVSGLARNIGRIVMFEDLWAYAWKGKPFNRKSVHVFVSRVRRRLAVYGLRIDSVVGVGYILSHGTCCSNETTISQSQEIQGRIQNPDVSG